MIILTINRNLGIYLKTDTDLKCVKYFDSSSQETEKLILELYSNFSTIWQTYIWPLISPSQTIEILLVIGSQAGFTDSRIISIWLNSLSMFEPNKTVLLAKYLEFGKNPDSVFYLDQNLSNILDNITWDKTLDAAIYTREPSIGKKAVK